MERLKKITADTVFVLQILIAFILIFESSIHVPPILQSFGRLHPVLLHLPIGLLLVTVILLFTRSYFEGKSLDELVVVLLHFSAFTASFTTLTGLLLSLEGTFGTDQLWVHKWMGIALSFLCWSLLLFKDKMKVLKPLGLAGVVLLIFTGHYGANLTHGEDFVWAPLQDDEPRVTRIITDSTAVFTATVEPILESKCYGCHNQKKAKGNLVLTSLESIKEGGKNGPAWKDGDAAHSLMIERLLLPLDHKEHMPPKDKTQLTDEELTFISLWIEMGADTEKKLIELAEEDTLRKLAAVIIPSYQEFEGDQPQYTFQFASPAKLKELSRPNRTVIQIAKNEPAVQADFFLRESFDPKYVEELTAVREQLISLNLSKMPLKDADLKTISKFSNLEVLNLNNTEITGSNFEALSPLSRLRSLSLSGTDISAGALRELGKLSGLKEVFLWNTSVTKEDVEALNKELSHIRWDLGYVSDDNEILKLNIPQVRNKSQVLAREERVALRHNLPGTMLRYTLDGSDPDSLESPAYKDPLLVGNYSSVKTRAFKDGWLTSDVAEFFFFRKGFKPDTITLLSPADKRYEGEGAITLVNEQKGLPDFYRHPAWIAFREGDLEFQFGFSKETPTVRHITLSFANNPYAMCMPPQEMQLWGGDNPASFKLIKRVSFTEPTTKPEKPRIEGVSMDVPASSFKYYKLVAKPMRNLAASDPNKRNLWLMVDEVFIN